MHYASHSHFATNALTSKLTTFNFAKFCFSIALAQNHKMNNKLLA